MKKENLTCSDLCSADSGRSPCIFPFYLTVVSSLKDMSDIFSNFFGLPRHIVLTILLMYSRDRIISSH